MCLIALQVYELESICQLLCCQQLDAQVLVQGSTAYNQTPCTAAAGDIMAVVSHRSSWQLHNLLSDPVK
jgi:hypothetical protein